MPTTRRDESLIGPFDVQELEVALLDAIQRWVPNACTGLLWHLHDWRLAAAEVTSRARRLSLRPGQLALSCGRGSHRQRGDQFPLCERAVARTTRFGQLLRLPEYAISRQLSACAQLVDLPHPSKPTDAFLFFQPSTRDVLAPAFGGLREDMKTERWLALSTAHFHPLLETHRDFRTRARAEEMTKKEIQDAIREAEEWLSCTGLARSTLLPRNDSSLIAQHHATPQTSPRTPLMASAKNRGQRPRPLQISARYGHERVLTVTDLYVGIALFKRTLRMTTAEAIEKWLIEGLGERPAVARRKAAYEGKKGGARFWSTTIEPIVRRFWP